MNWRNDPHFWWVISAIISNVHPRNFRCLRQDSNPWPVQGQCSEFTNQAMKPMTQMWSSQSPGLMCFRERIDEGQKCGWEMNWRNDLHTCWTISAMVHIWENRWSCPANKFYRIGNLLTSWTIVSSFFLLSSFFFCFFSFFCWRLQTWKRSWGYKKNKNTAKPEHRVFLLL